MHMPGLQGVEQGMLASRELRSACSYLGTRSATLAVQLRQAEQGRLPAPHDAADAAALVQYARKLQAAQAGEASVNQELLDKLAYTAAGELSPMAAIIGGCVGQEARPPAQAHVCRAPFQTSAKGLETACPFLSQAAL